MSLDLPVTRRVLRMRSRWVAGLLFLATCAPTFAGPIERDLGEGLAYFRIRAVPTDLPSDEAVHKRVCVLDLRYTEVDAMAARVLDGWIRLHAATRRPMLLLVNRETSTNIQRALAERDGIPGLLTIGGPNLHFAPDIAVNTASDAERRAYEALENGTDLPSLVTDNPTKQRNDEASLARERPVDFPTDSDGAGSTEKPASEKSKAPPTDVALQRAIHIHRALKAMKKID